MKIHKLSNVYYVMLLTLIIIGVATAGHIYAWDTESAYDYDGNAA
jgi:hypothetical protein